MNVGQALINERTSDCVVSVCVCMCALVCIQYVCVCTHVFVTLSVLCLYSLNDRQTCGFRQIYPLILHKVGVTWAIFCRALASSHLNWIEC